MQEGLCIFRNHGAGVKHLLVALDQLRTSHKGACEHKPYGEDADKNDRDPRSGGYIEARAAATAADRLFHRSHAPFSRLGSVPRHEHKDCKHHGEEQHGRSTQTLRVEPGECVVHVILQHVHGLMGVVTGKLVGLAVDFEDLNEADDGGEVHKRDDLRQAYVAKQRPRPRAVEGGGFGGVFVD